VEKELQMFLTNFLFDSNKGAISTYYERVVIASVKQRIGQEIGKFH